jgi:hypothetical protein
MLYYVPPSLLFLFVMPLSLDLQLVCLHSPTPHDTSLTTILPAINQSSILIIAL